MLALATVLAAEGRPAEADPLLAELLTLGPKLVPALVGELSAGLIMLAWLVRGSGREREVLDTLAAAPSVPWVLAAQAVVSGDFDGAAAVLAGIGFRPGEAYTRLRAAEELARAGRTAEADAHLKPALDFYREVGATRFVREGESLASS